MVSLSKTGCRTHDSALQTLGLGHTSRSCDSAAGDLAVLQTAVLLTSNENSVTEECSGSVVECKT